MAFWFEQLGINTWPAWVSDGRLVATFTVVVGLAVIRLAIQAFSARRIRDPRARYLWRKTTTYVTVTVGLFLLGAIWLRGFGDLATYFGLLSAGVAVALRDWITNLFGWLFILARRPFGLGDRIQIGQHAGDVIDLRVFAFSMLEIGNWVGADQSTGRVIHIPNGMVMTEPLANFSSGFPYIWHEIPVLVTFESNWREAKAILSEAADRHGSGVVEEATRRIHEASARWLIRFTKLTPIVYTSVADSGVLLTLRMMVDPRARRGIEQAVWEDILERFAARDDIDFAYPTQRFYDNVLEGKPEDGGAPRDAGAPNR